MLIYLVGFLQLLGFLTGTAILLEEKIERKFFLSILISVSIINTPMYLFFGTGGVFLLLFIIFLILYLRTRKIIFTLVAVCLPPVLSVLSFFLLEFVFYFFPHSINSTWIDAVFPLLIMLPTCYFLKRVIFQKQSWDFLRSGYGKFIVTFLFTLLLLTYSDVLIGQYLGFSQRFLLLRGGLLIIYALLLSFLVFWFYRSFKKEMDQEKEKVFLSYQLEQARLANAHYEEIKSFKHDFHNMIMITNHLLSEKNYAGLRKYLKEFSQEFKEGGREGQIDFSPLINLKNLELEILLKEKMNEAQRHGIATTLEIIEEIPPLPLTLMEQVRVFGILLDNAIEEAVETEEKKIQLAFINNEDYIWIILTNSCQGKKPLKAIYSKGFSTRSGKERGMGLYNLKEILGRYPSHSVETNIEENLFIQKVILKSGAFK